MVQCVDGLICHFEALGLPPCKTHAGRPNCSLDIRSTRDPVILARMEAILRARAIGTAYADKRLTAALAIAGEKEGQDG